MNTDKRLKSKTWDRKEYMSEGIQNMLQTLSLYVLQCNTNIDIIYIFKIRKLQFCRVRGGLTALTAKLDCSHCRSTSLQPKFNWGGVWLHSLQSWTAVTADQLHCSPSSTPGGGVWLHSLQSWTAVTAAQDHSSLQPKFNWGVQLHSLQSWTAVTADQLHCSPSSTGGVWLHSLQSWTAVTADHLHCSPSSTGGVQLHSLQSWTAVTADQLHCSPSSTRGGGCDCTHCKVGLQSLQINFTAVLTKFNCRPTSLGGGPTALTAKLDCSHCRSTSLQPKFNWGGVWLHSLQSWTAVTADQLHCSPSSTGGGSDCTHCKVGLQSLQINFTAAQVQLGGGLTALTAKLDYSHCRSTSLQPKFKGGVQLQSLQSWTAVTADQLHCSPSSKEGSNCTHCKVGLQSLQINFTAAQVQLGGIWLHSLQSWTAVTADQLHCSPSSTGGGLTALTAKLDCSHCRSTSLQPKFNWGGSVWDQ